MWGNVQIVIAHTPLVHVHVFAHVFAHVYTDTDQDALAIRHIDIFKNAVPVLFKGHHISLFHRFANGTHAITIAHVIRATDGVAVEAVRVTACFLDCDS
jgi:hypothetical protein